MTSTDQIIAYLEAANGTKTIREMAAELGVTYGRINNVTQRTGLPFKRILRPAYQPNAQDDIVIREMRKRGNTYMEIASALDIPKDAVLARLRFMGLLKRPTHKGERPVSLNTKPIRCDDTKFRKLMGNKRFEDDPRAKSTKNPQPIAAIGHRGSLSGGMYGNH